jgi:hypothetical protein
MDYTELLGDHRLSEGMLCLTLLFNDISSVTSTASLCVGLCLILALGFGKFKLSLEVFIEFTILGLNTMAVHGLLPFHHFERSGKFSRQHLQQQQQQNMIITRPVVTIPACHEGEMIVYI